MTSASWSGASVVWLLVLAAVAALVFVPSRGSARVAPRGDEASTSHPSRALIVAMEKRLRRRQPDDGAASSRERTPPEQALGAIDPNDAWRERAARAVRPIITESASAARRRTRNGAWSTRSAPSGPPRAASTAACSSIPTTRGSIARIRERTRAGRADRTLRDLLGIGVAELLRRLLDPSGIDDQGSAAANG
ncbi:MAG: hypothetical protein U1F09_16325 [Steroidobacteraceae bacterium]